MPSTPLEVVAAQSPIAFDEIGFEFVARFSEGFGEIALACH